VLSAHKIKKLFNKILLFAAFILKDKIMKLNKIGKT
jgi:hypothetical protein